MADESVITGTDENKTSKRESSLKHDAMPKTATSPAPDKSPAISAEKEQNSKNESSLETDAMPRGTSHSPDESTTRNVHLTSKIHNQNIDDPLAIPDSADGKSVTDKASVITTVQRKSRSSCRARSRDPNKCQMNFREIIGKHETRNEELEQLEGDLRERLDMLECSMPAVMVWNVLRTAQGAPPSVVRSLMEKQLQGVHDAGNLSIPSTPSQHYDCRVREIEAERKEALKRAEEARSLLTEKEAVVEERQKRLEEAKKNNQERKERIERLNREVAQLREATKNARGDDASDETGECGEVRCKEKLLGHIGSLSSLDSEDLDCFARLQELAESEVCMKRQINELERREEIYMRTLQQAEGLWSKMEGDGGDGVRELREQLALKTAANQRLADRVCQLEDELEKLKKRLIGYNEELKKLTGKEHVDAEIGIEDGIASVEDRGVVAAVTMATSFASASPQTVDVDSTAHPKTKDKESSFAPESDDKGVGARAKTSDKLSEALVDRVEREVDRPFETGIDAGVGDTAIVPHDDSQSQLAGQRKPTSHGPYETDFGEEAQTAEASEVYPKDMVESSTGMENTQPFRSVPTSESRVQATVEMVEQPVGGSEPEDIAEIVREVQLPPKTDAQKDPPLSSVIAAAEDERSTAQTMRDTDQPEFEDKRDHDSTRVSGKDDQTVVDDGKGVRASTKTFDKYGKPIVNAIESKVKEIRRATDRAEPQDKRVTSHAKVPDGDVETMTVDGKSGEASAATHDDDSKAIGGAMAEKIVGTKSKADRRETDGKSVSERPDVSRKDSEVIIDRVEREVEKTRRDQPKPDDKRAALSPKASGRDSKTIVDREERAVQEITREKREPELENESIGQQPKISSKHRSEVIIDQIDRGVDENAEADDQSQSDETVVRKRAEKKDTNVFIDKMDQEVDDTGGDKRLSESKERSVSRRAEKISQDGEAVIDQIERAVDDAGEEIDMPGSHEKRVSKRPKMSSENSKEIVDSTEPEVYESPADIDSFESNEKSIDKRTVMTDDEGGKSVSKPPEIFEKSSKTIIDQPDGQLDEKTAETASPKSEEKSIGKVRDRTEKKPDEEEEIPETSKPDSEFDEKTAETASPKSEEKDIGKARDRTEKKPDEEEEIPEAWKNWNWDEGCPPDIVCNDDEDPDVCAAKIAQVAETTVRPEQETDTVTLSREELRNWYNIANSIHHAISRCIYCKSEVDATAQLMGKMNNHLWMMAFADEEDPMTSEEIAKSVSLVAKIPPEVLGAPNAEPRAYDEAADPDLDADKQSSQEDVDIMAISIVRTTILLEAQLGPSDELAPEGNKIPMDVNGNEQPGLEQRKEPSVAETSDDEKKSPTSSTSVDQQLPALTEKQEPQPLSDESDMDPEKSIPPPTSTVISTLEPSSELKPQTHDEITEDRKAGKKLRTPEPLDSCICPPPFCHPVSTSSREPNTEGTQTSPQFPRTLDRIKRKNVPENAWRSPDVVMWRRPLIWSSRRKDKSTVTTVSVDTQTDTTIPRERTTYRGFDRKDDGTCSGKTPRKPQVCGFYDRVSSRHTDERLPASARDAVGELFDPPTLRPAMPPREREIAVTTYTGKPSTPVDSELHCVDCGRPITPEDTSFTLKTKLRARTKSQKSLMQTLKKIATSTTSRTTRKKENCTCHECKILDTAKTENARKSKPDCADNLDGNTRDKELCCPCPAEVKEKSVCESSKPSRKKRKPQKKDQSVAANIPRNKVRKIAKEKKGIEDTDASGRIKDKIELSSREGTAPSETGHSGSSAAGCSDENSWTDKLRSKADETLKQLVTKDSSDEQSPHCGCSENNSSHVPFTNYSSIFRANIAADGCAGCPSIESDYKVEGACNCPDMRE